MSPQFWIERWEGGRTGWHLDHVNPRLRTFESALGAPPRRVLVPLCGRSLDLAYLVSRGHEVVGVDASERALRGVFEDSGRAFEEEVRGDGRLLSGEGLTLWQGDFFRLRLDEIGKFDTVYDRAAAISVDPGRRSEYALRLRAVLAKGGTLVLIGIDYPQSMMSGPPYAMPVGEAIALFPGRVETLFDEDVLEEELKFKKRGLPWLREYGLRIDF